MKNEIEAKDLRIGNCVTIYEKQNRIVTEILSRYIETSFRGGLLKYTGYEDLQGIPITPEILEKAGFEYDGITHYKGRVMLSQRKYREWDVWYGSLTYGRIDECNISFVHQLQNLIFALTNEELNIEL